MFESLVEANPAVARCYELANEVFCLNINNIFTSLEMFFQWLESMGGLHSTVSRFVSSGTSASKGRTPLSMKYMMTPMLKLSIV